MRSSLLGFDTTSPRCGGGGGGIAVALMEKLMWKLIQRPKKMKITGSNSGLENSSLKLRSVSSKRQFRFEFLRSRILTKSH